MRYWLSLAICGYRSLAWKGVVIVGEDPAKRTHRGGGHLVAFDTRDGKVRWERDFPAGDFNKGKDFPDRCILGGRLYITDGDSCLVLDAITGRDCGRLEAPEASRGWSYLAASDGRLYGAAHDRRTVFCVEAATGRELWSRRIEDGVYLPALSAGRMYLAPGGGALIECAAQRAEATRELFAAALGAAWTVQLVRDLTGRQRAVRVTPLAAAED